MSVLDEPLPATCQSLRNITHGHFVPTPESADMKPYILNGLLTLVNLLTGFYKIKFLKRYRLICAFVCVCFF